MRECNGFIVYHNSNRALILQTFINQLVRQLTAVFSFRKNLLFLGVRILRLPCYLCLNLLCVILRAALRGIASSACHKAGGYSKQCQ